MSTPMTADRAENPPPDRLTILVSLLRQALRELGDAGRPREANLLAARAYVELRGDRPQDAQQINALMHRLARQETAADRKEIPMPTQAPELDVRNDPPPRRHELIFDTYAALAEGEAFVLVNDHDPKPLYYQLAAEHPGEFSWDYLESGPEVWKVQIGRTAVKGESS